MNKTTFLTQCPCCGQEFEAQAEWKGMETDCPSCNSKFTITEKQIFVEDSPKQIKGDAFQAFLQKRKMELLNCFNYFQSKYLAKVKYKFSSSEKFSKYNAFIKKYKIAILVLILSFLVSGSICLVQDNIIIISKTKDIENVVSVHGGFPPKIKYLILDNVKSFFRGFYFAYNLKEKEYVWKFFYRYGGSEEADFYLEIYEQNLYAKSIIRRNELLKGY